MNSITGKSNHKDFSSHIKRDPEGGLSPVPHSKGHADMHKTVNEFSKRCESPTVHTADNNKSYISDSEIR
ncbi:MAG: hypothetical protein ACI4KF_09805 [Huintestinicola sp.]